MSRSANEKAGQNVQKSGTKRKNKQAQLYDETTVTPVYDEMHIKAASSSVFVTANVHKQAKHNNNTNRYMAQSM